MVMCDRIAVLNDGTVEQVGDPAEIYERPANRFVADFVGTSNVLSATVGNGVLDLGFATCPCDSLARTGNGNVIVRPDDFEVGGDQFEGILRDRFYLGERVRARVELPGGQLVTVDLDGDGRRVGDSVGLSLKTEGLHVIDAGTDQSGPTQAGEQRS